MSTIDTWADDGGAELVAPKAPATSTTTHPTREGWLAAGMKALGHRYFEDKGYGLPARMQCSCGWCRGNAKAIGQCWSPEVTADGTTHMFICPTLGEPVTVLATLLHEMIHAAIGVEEKHGKLFRKLAKEMGLAGRATATYAEPGTPLHADLCIIAEKLGVYPHSAMVKKPAKQKKSNGWIRLRSTEDENYKVVISPKMVEEHGAPVDPWGNEMVPMDWEGESE